MKKLAFATLLVALLAGTSQAEAIILNFDLDKHPNAGQAFHPVATSHDFNFVSATMSVDTSTGKATLGGTVVDIDSGELWLFSGMLDGIGSSGMFWNSLPPVPFDTMFSELLANGNSSARIFYAEAKFEIAPTILNPTYTGPRLFVNNTNNLPAFGGEDLDIHRRIVNSQPYLVIESGWWAITEVNGVVDGQRSHGNYRWIITKLPQQEHPPVPEPVTSVLFGLGSVAGLISRRRRAS